MAIGYGSLLSRASAFAIRNPRLWVLGLFVSASGGGGSGDLARILERDEVPLGPLAPFLTGLLVLLVLLGLVLLLVTVLAEGALIAAAREAAEARRPRLLASLRAGAAAYPRLLLLYAALVAALFALLVPLVGIPLLVWRVLGNSLVVTILLLLALAPPYLLLALAAIFIFEWAPRAAVLEGTGPADALAAALRAIRRDAARGFTLVLGSLLNEAIALSLLLVAAVPFAIAGALLFDVSPLLVVIPGAPFVALLLTYLGLKGSFTSGYWTLAFLDHAARGGATDPWGEAVGGI